MKSGKYIPFLLGATAALHCAAAPATPAPQRPSLAVNIVLSGIPYDFFSRYEANLTEDGFRKFMREGTVFTESRYEYMPTNSVSSLATLTTGAYPSVHGVVGRQWCDVLTGQTVSLIDDPAATGFDCEFGEGCYSGALLTTPTLGDRLRRGLSREQGDQHRRRPRIGHRDGGPGHRGLLAESAHGLLDLLERLHALPAPAGSPTSTNSTRTTPISATGSGCCARMRCATATGASATSSPNTRDASAGWKPSRPCPA